MIDNAALSNLAVLPIATRRYEIRDNRVDET
jgi:hypothetical protein